MNSSREVTSAAQCIVSVECFAITQSFYLLPHHYTSKATKAMTPQSLGMLLQASCLIKQHKSSSFLFFRLCSFSSIMEIDELTIQSLAVSWTISNPLEHSFHIFAYFPSRINFPLQSMSFKAPSSQALRTILSSFKKWEYHLFQKVLITSKFK